MVGWLPERAFQGTGLVLPVADQSTSALDSEQRLAHGTRKTSRKNPTIFDVVSSSKPHPQMSTLMLFLLAHTKFSDFSDQSLSLNKYLQLINYNNVLILNNVISVEKY